MVTDHIKRPMQPAFCTHEQRHHGLDRHVLGEFISGGGSSVGVGDDDISHAVSFTTTITNSHYITLIRVLAMRIGIGVISVRTYHVLFSKNAPPTRHMKYTPSPYEIYHFNPCMCYISLVLKGRCPRHASSPLTFHSKRRRCCHICQSFPCFVPKEHLFDNVCS